MKVRIVVPNSSIEMNNQIIRKLVDYTLLNACSINSSGLFNGKAGIALALFEAAHYLQDEYIEDQAFDLLLEALLSKTEDISFENGLSGIGYVLIYLIENDFINANFDDFFKEQLEKIIAGLDKQKQNSNFLLNSIRITRFLASAKLFRKADKRIDEIIKSLFEANEIYLGIQFFHFKDIDYINNKNVILERFEVYLQMVCECRYANYSRVVLDHYAGLYKKGRIISSYKVSYYLRKIDNEGKYKDVIEGNKRYSGLKSTKIHTLRHRIDLAKISGEIGDLQEVILEGNEKKIEKEVLEHILNGAFTSGYEQGISRLLIYLTNKKSILF